MCTSPTSPPPPTRCCARYPTPSGPASNGGPTRRPQRSLGSPVGALGVAHHEVAARVQALFSPPPPGRTSQVALALALSILVLLIGINSLASIQDAIESASRHSGFVR